MTGVLIALAAFGALAAALAVTLGTAHGRLTRLRTALENAFARLDQGLSRHHATVQAHLAELSGPDRDAIAGALERAETARGEAGPRDPEGATRLREAVAALEGALRAEGQPPALAESRERLHFALEAYDAAVAAYETGRRRFPGAGAAALLGFGEARRLRPDGTEE
jgi:hypothetical protein